jgi:hypothetical protein
MAEPSREINIIELLMGIKEDVSSIKTDMANFKETQRAEKEAISRDIADVRSDYRRDLADLESRVMSKLTGLQSVQNNLVGDVDTLKHADEQKDAKLWKTVIAFVLTSIGSMVLVKLPDFVSLLLRALNGS